jgi:hypothetical protein
MACLVALVAGCTAPQANPALVPARGPNLIRNGDFSGALENWGVIGDGPNAYHPDDPGRAVFNVRGGSLAIEITNQGISIWSVMLHQSVELEKGATYDVSFDAQSESGVQVVSNFCDDATWRNFSGNRSFRLTRSMSRYAYRFTMAGDGKALFQICLGISGTGRVRLGNIVVLKSGRDPTAGAD